MTPISSTRFHSSSGCSSGRCRLVAPTLLTRMSSWPKVSSTAANMRSISSGLPVSAVSASARRPCASIAGFGFAQPVLLQIAKRDIRAGAGQPDGDRLADAVGAAGDQGHSPIESKQ